MIQIFSDMDKSIAKLAKDSGNAATAAATSSTISAASANALRDSALTASEAVNQLTGSIDDLASAANAAAGGSSGGTKPSNAALPKVLQGTSDSDLDELERQRRAYFGQNGPGGNGGMNPIDDKERRDHDDFRALFGGPNVPRYAEGTDYVRQTGPAIVHEGEEIIPKGKRRQAIVVNITVQGHVLSDSDFAKRMAREITKQVEQGGGVRLVASEVRRY